MASKWDFVREESLNDDGQFDSRNVPAFTVLNIRLLHYRPDKSALGGTIDIVIEPDDEGSRIRVVRGDVPIPDGTVLWVRGEQ